jgi:tetratricopeptide (TPR) repeat protein
VQFTEKKFPHLPTRESHEREPPYPKSKKMEKQDPESGYVDIEERDPVWLKDKADHFFKRNDFTAAVTAYSKAIKADANFLSGYLNRAACWIKMRHFDNALKDCEDIERVLADTKKEEKEGDMFYSKVEARMLVKKGAAYAWLS